MFSDKDRESWQNIKAPASLLEKTAMRLDEDTSVRKISYKKMFMPLVAACFIIVVVVAFMMMGTTDARIYIGENELKSTMTFDLSSEPMMLARSAQSSVVLTLELEKESEISTLVGTFDVIELESDVGNVNFLTSYKAKGRVLVKWTYPIPADGEFVTLDVVTGKDKQTVKISHDSENGIKNVTLVKK